MELSRNSVDETKKRTGLGHCRHFFWLGVIFDIVGATALFTGALADLSHCGLLLYLGSIIVFFSLLWWVFWYTGNMELTPEEVWKGPLHVLSTTVLDTLRQNVSHRFSWSFCDVSTTFMRIRRLRARRSFFRRAGPLILTVTGQTAERTEEEDKDKDGMKNIKKSSDAEDCGREDVGPEPEAVQSSEGVCLPGPDAGPLGPEAGRPTFVERLWTQEVESEVTPSPLNQPLPPAILTSVVPLSSASQPPVIHASISLPLSFSGQPLDTLASKNLNIPLMVSQGHPLVSVAPQGNFQNLSLAPQTQPQPAQASQDQALATPVSVIQFVPARSLKAQPVDLRVILAVQDFPALYENQQAPQSSALVREIALSQSSLARDIPKKPVA